MLITKEEKAAIIAKYGQSATDTGSADVQVALLTEEINRLQSHFAAHPKDYAGKRGLMKKIGQRRSLLNYLRATDFDRYHKLIDALKLRK